MNLDQALQTFFAEGRELLADMEAALLRVADCADGADSADSIGAVFRAAHTIKGSAGLFGLDGVVSFTHVVESALDAVRAGALALDGALIALLLRCGDHIGSLLDAVEGGAGTVEPELDAEGTVMMVQLRARMADADAGSKPVGAGAGVRNAPATPAKAASGATPATASAAAPTDAGGGNDHWHISVRFGANVLRNGMDPLSFVRYLATLGSIERIVTLPDAVPALAALDAESCCLGFEIAFRSAADKAAIEGRIRVRHRRLHAQHPAAAQPARSLCRADGAMPRRRAAAGRHPAPLRQHHGARARCGAAVAARRAGPVRGRSRSAACPPARAPSRRRSWRPWCSARRS